MAAKDREPLSMTDTAVEALRGVINVIRGEQQIPPRDINTLFRTVRLVAQDVMGLNPVAATLFAMRFGTIILPIYPIRDERITPIDSPPRIEEEVGKYLLNHFSLDAVPDISDRTRLIAEVRSRFSSAEVSTDYIDKIYNTAEGMAQDVLFNSSDGLIDKNSFTVQYFTDSAASIPERPALILDETGYPEFMDQTGVWLRERFDDILNKIPQKEEPQTFEDAQQVITQALQDIQANRKVDDEGREMMLPAHEEAIRSLKKVLQNLPTDVACVSIGVAFDTVNEETSRKLPGWLGSYLRTLQHFLAQIGANAGADGKLEFEFTILPNLPTEQAGNKPQTVYLKYDFGIHFLEINPIIGQEGLVTSWPLDIKTYSVPLQIVKSIQLHRERKPLTPYLLGAFEDLRIIPAEYPKSNV